MAQTVYTSSVLMAAKRKFEEFDVSNRKQSPNAIVHGVVTSLSPIKNSKKSENVEFFSGLFSDGNGCKRLISFVPRLRAPLDESMMKKKTISFVSCQVRETTVGESEIVLTKYSTIQPSSRKFDLSALVTQSDAPVIHMEDLCSLTSHTSQKVTVSVKVKHVNPQEIVNNRHGKQLNKQDCIVAYSTACGKVVLWEKDIDRSGQS